MSKLGAEMQLPEYRVEATKHFLAPSFAAGPFERVRTRQRHRVAAKRRGIPASIPVPVLRRTQRIECSKFLYPLPLRESAQAENRRRCNVSELQSLLAGIWQVPFPAPKLCANIGGWWNCNRLHA